MHEVLTDERVLESRALTVAEEAKAITIRDSASFGRAAEALRMIKAMSAEITTFFSPLKEKAFAAHKALTTAEKEKLAPLVDAERALKAGMASWQQVEELKRREEERRLQEEARKRAEEDRLLEAIDLEAAGEKEAAGALLEAPVEAPVVVLRPVVEAAGVSFVERWRAVVTDPVALARGIADGTVPPMAMLPNQAWLDGQARALKGSMRYPGVRSQPETSVSARTA